MSLARPLEGVKIIEFEGLGPGPLSARMLAGMGASVTTLVRPKKVQLFSSGNDDKSPNAMQEEKVFEPCDLKSAEGLARAKELIASSDVLIEGNRPGVMERLGLGPKEALELNPLLIYARMTGWGQSGPLAQAAGHDLNYVALTGLLSLSQSPGAKPSVPPTVVGDASGALGLAFGVACAIADVRAGGPGRVLDAAIVDVVAMLGMLAQTIRAVGQLDSDVPSPFHDSPYYDTYECSDGRFVTVGALEPQFYDLLLSKLGMEDVDRSRQNISEDWPALKKRISAVFLSQPREHWSELLEGTDVCFAPVLSVAEAAQHPHNVTRNIFATKNACDVRPSIAPRFLAVN